MAENQNPNVKEEVNENVEVEATEFTEFTSEKESITDEIKKAQEENSQKVTDALAEAERQLKEARLKAFLKEKGLDEGIKFSDLTPEQRAEYDNYDLPEEEKTRIYENAKNAIIPITKDRTERLDSMEDRITGLYNKAKDKQVELKDELSKLPATPENEEKRAQLEKDIASMENIMGELGKEKGDESPMRATLAAAFKTHENSNKGVRMKLGKLFGEERVNSDPDIQNTLMTAKERKEMGIEPKTTDEKGQEVEEKNEEEQEKENKEAKAGQKIDPQTAAKLQEALKAAGVGAAAAAAATAKKDIVLGEDVSFADILGYAPYNGVNFKSSMDVLDVFLGKKDSPSGIPMNDGVRIALLSSPEGAMIVQNALMRINTEPGKFDFINKFKAFNANRQIKKMIEKQLPSTLKARSDEVSKEDKEKVASDLAFNGIDLNKDIQSQLKDMKPEEINLLQEKIDGLNSNYKAKIAELNEKLNDNSLSEENRKIYQAQLDAYTEKRKVLGSSIADYVGVHRFTEISKDAMKGEKNQVYMLNPEPTIKEAEENSIDNARGQIKDMDNISKEELKKIAFEEKANQEITSIEKEEKEIYNN